MMEHLIIKYLNKKLTKAEENQLNQWLEKDKINRRIFENIVADWSLSASDIEKSKRRVYNNLLNTKINTKKRPNVFSYLVKVAAVLVMVLCVSLIYKNFNEQNQDSGNANSIVKIEKHSLLGQKLRLKLPDGTLVILNSGSKLVTPESFEGQERKVFLEGEAYFDVVKDASKPFIIETNVTNVKVLGTSFNVRSYPEEGDVSVAVNSGKVQVSDKNGFDAHLLNKNEMLVYSISRKSFSKQLEFDDELMFGWKDQNLVFEDESIEKMLIRLSRWYDVEFKLLVEVDKEKKFTARFKNQTLEAVMKSISFNYEFEFEINGKEVIIK